MGLVQQQGTSGNCALDSLHPSQAPSQGLYWVLVRKPADRGGDQKETPLVVQMWRQGLTGTAGKA